MTELYDEIGVGYRARRRPDPRLAAAITRALGETETVAELGNGWKSTHSHRARAAAARAEALDR